MGILRKAAITTIIIGALNFMNVPQRAWNYTSDGAKSYVRQKIRNGADAVKEWAAEPEPSKLETKVEEAKPVQQEIKKDSSFHMGYMGWIYLGGTAAAVGLLAYRARNVRRMREEYGRETTTGQE